jgi:hypothetical protein
MRRADADLRAEPAYGTGAHCVSNGLGLSIAIVSDDARVRASACDLRHGHSPLWQVVNCDAHDVGILAAIHERLVTAGIVVPRRRWRQCRHSRLGFALAGFRETVSIALNLEVRRGFWSVVAAWFG